MKPFSFQAQSGLIVVHAELTGPSAAAVMRLALDTGATRTLVNTAMLVAVGCDPAQAASRVEMTTGSGVEYAPLVTIQQVKSLGRVRHDLEVLAHTLPPSAGIDGVLGLDFFRGTVLTVDFLQGVITCA